MLFQFLYLYFSRMAYNIEGAILNPVSSRVSIYTCMEKCTPATIYGSLLFNVFYISPRFLCRPTAYLELAVAVGRQRALHKQNSEFASRTLQRHISTFCGYQILFSIRNPYINRFTNHFSIHS